MLSAAAGGAITEVLSLPLAVSWHEVSEIGVIAASTDAA